MTEDDLPQRVGTVVREKWTLVRLLGVGGMAAVYVGVHRIGRRDALKILHPEAAKSKEVCLRFEREAQAVNRFRHPGAVEIRDIDVTEDGSPFLVMELLVGESLGERAQQLGRLQVAEVLGVTEQVLDVLAAAHAQGIIHRDIKPANLFLLSDGRVKVLDFGLARIHEGGRFDGLWTKEGTTLGTTPYMPPEQAKGRPIDERADVFAVGATFFRLVAGRYIHQASGAFELLMKMGKEPAPPLASIDPSIPRDVCAVIDRSLAFDREQRYPEASMMLEDVRAILRGARPEHALRLGGGVDRGAATEDGHKRAPQSPGVVPDTKGPATSEEIPIYLSGFSSIQVLGANEDDTDPTPLVVLPPGHNVEHTLVSPVAGDDEKPAKA